MVAATRPLPRSLALVACATAIGTACANVATVELRTSPQAFTIAAPSVAPPPDLRDDSSTPAVIRVVLCDASTVCPSRALAPVTCSDGRCDPAARTLVGSVGGVVDFGTLVSGAAILRSVDVIVVLGGDYEVSPNSLTVPVPPMAIYWGPEGAADVSAPGVHLLGAIPAVAPSAPAAGEMTIDAAGAASISEYLANESQRVRFFALTRFDFAPGDPFPDGSAVARISLRARASGPPRE